MLLQAVVLDPLAVGTICLSRIVRRAVWGNFIPYADGICCALVKLWCIEAIQLVPTPERVNHWPGCPGQLQCIGRCWRRLGRSLAPIASIRCVLERGAPNHCVMTPIYRMSS